MNTFAATEYVEVVAGALLPRHYSILAETIVASRGCSLCPVADERAVKLVPAVAPTGPDYSNIVNSLARSGWMSFVCCLLRRVPRLRTCPIARIGPTLLLLVVVLVVVGAGPLLHSPSTTMTSTVAMRGSATTSRAQNSPTTRDRSRRCPPMSCRLRRRYRGVHLAKMLELGKSSHLCGFRG